MFFDGLDLTPRKRAILAEPPRVPETGWQRPQYYPELRGATCIAFDVETKEEDFDHGPGWARGKARIVGISFAAVWASGERGKWYFPIRHEVEAEWNLCPQQTLAWAKEQLETPNIPKIGANLIYDCGNLSDEGIYPQGDLHDVQFAEALLSEDGEVNLEYIGQKYVGRGKASDVLYSWIQKAYPRTAPTKLRGEIWRTPPRLVGPYAEDDADIPIGVLAAQWSELEAQGLMPLYRMECENIPLLIRMRRRGIRVDVPYTEKLYGEMGLELVTMENEFVRQSGWACNPDSNLDLAKLFDQLKIDYPRTGKRTDANPDGSPSFQGTFLKSVDHPAAKAVLKIREYRKLRSTFMRAYILERHKNSIIYPSFHPMRSPDGGARTGRFASSDPNKQNIPARTKIGKKIRNAYIAHQGDVGLRKGDYSQIEYRFHVHFAVGPGSDEARRMFCDDPTTDYHDYTYNLVRPYMGWPHLQEMDAEERGLRRKPIKNINFGLLYGMAERKLAASLGIPREEAQALLRAYHEGNPYTKATMDACIAEALTNGYITTILGRRARFELWEPMFRDYGKDELPLPYDYALRKWGHAIVRAKGYTAINSRYQGSAADQMKMGMHALMKSGVLDYIGPPILTVHDELVFSDPGGPHSDEAFAFVKHTMETCIQLRVPIIFEMSSGPNWGACG